MDLLQTDAEIMWQEDINRLSSHFRSCISEARKQSKEEHNLQSFHVIMKEMCTDENVRAWLSDLLTGQAKGSRQISRLLSSDVKAAGDFDASGLQIAQGLKLRYGSRLLLWNYKKEFYELALSDEVLKEQELRKLDKVTVEELQEIKECLLEVKRAAYQENMLGSYVVE